MTHTKQFSLYSGVMGPNPWKVAIILEELGLEWETVMVNIEAGDHKQQPYTDLNPNGRVPTLIDHHNNDFRIWESGAIIEYLITKYDPEHKLSFTKLEDEMLARQWLIFQVSGQGPYYGQAGFLLYFFPEKLPSAIERYQNETKRVLMVLNNHLTEKKATYLVNNKCSYADLAFFMYNSIVPLLIPGFDWKAEYPAAASWHDALAARSSVVKILSMRQAAIDAQAAAAVTK